MAIQRSFHKHRSLNTRIQHKTQSLRKVNSKIPKADHIKPSYRCFKSFNDCAFLVDLRHDLQNFQINRATVDEDFEAFHNVIINRLNKHAPIKTLRVKSNRLPAWYTSEIGQARIARDKYKRLKQWTEYKYYRKKTRNLIRKSKRRHFTNSVENLTDTAIIGIQRDYDPWKRFTK